MRKRKERLCSEYIFTRISEQFEFNIFGFRDLRPMFVSSIWIGILQTHFYALIKGYSRNIFTLLSSNFQASAHVQL